MLVSFATALIWRKKCCTCTFWFDVKTCCTTQLHILYNYKNCVPKKVKMSDFWIWRKYLLQFCHCDQSIWFHSTTAHTICALSSFLQWLLLDHSSHPNLTSDSSFWGLVLTFFLVSWTFIAFYESGKTVIENDIMMRIMNKQRIQITANMYSYRQIFFWDFSSSFLTPFT